MEHTTISKASAPRMRQCRERRHMHEAIIAEVRPRTERLVLLIRTAAVCGIALAGAACSQRGVSASDGAWDPKAAAAYLDRRMEWWSGWKGSARDHGTFCFSCHTAVPYALARPALSATL